MKANFMCCKNCKERYVGCHSTCKEYNDKKSKYDKIKQIENQKRNEIGALNDIKVNGIKRMKKNRNRKG